ncbi:MAG: DUF3857 domain-containing transglutaminase family protein [Ramlibacter sp.]
MKLNQVHKWLYRFAAALGLTWAATVSAQDAVAHSYIDQIWHAHYDVSADGRTVETVTYRYKVLQHERLEDFKVYSLSFSTSIQTGEVLEAYTLKADGRQIDVPPGNYQTQTNQGRQGAGPAFSDRTRLSVVFPELAVGDSVHVRYRITEREPMFPGQFSLALSQSPFRVAQDARIVIRHPASMALKTQAFFFQPQPEVVADGFRTREWRWTNPSPRSYDADRDNGIWKISETPMVLASTFQSYEAIAKAYGDRALPRAQPDQRVREIVKDVLLDEAQPREKARKLYEWVSRNITYGGNCIGVGAVVPRELNVVLDNRMGDCKDHATLLQAMLSAAGITSEQVLVNAGSSYELAEVPVVSMVNHVMNYLPTLGLYVDATAKEIPFGYLPTQAYAKPVIHVGREKALAKVPDQRHQDNEQRLFMKLKIAADGSATGELNVALKGVNAANVRSYMRALTADAEKDFVRRVFSSSGMRGNGTVSRGATQGLSDNYAFSMTFSVSGFLRGGSNGAFSLEPVLNTPLPVTAFANVADRPEATRASYCYGFHSYETYDIELAPNLKLLSVPDPLEVKASLVDYSARYEQVPSGLRVTRELHDKTPVSICQADMMTLLHKQAEPVGENLRAQVLYRRSAP